MKKVTILCVSSLFALAGMTTSCKSAKAPQPVAEVAPVAEEPKPAPAPVPAPAPIDVAGINARINAMLNQSPVTFEIDRDELSATSKSNIEMALPLLKQFPSVPVNINGYCDESGSVELNAVLSKKRAEAVKTYLISKGLDAARFQTEGLGFADPVAPNTTPENRAKNRRAVFVVSLTEQVILEAKTKGLL